VLAKDRRADLRRTSSKSEEPNIGSTESDSGFKGVPCQHGEGRGKKGWGDSRPLRCGRKHLCQLLYDRDETKGINSEMVGKLYLGRK